MTLVYSGNNVRAVREELGLSQRELAERVHMPQSLISAIERGVLKPWPKAAKRLSRVLKIPSCDLFPRGLSNGQRQ